MVDKYGTVCYEGQEGTTGTVPSTYVLYLTLVQLPLAVINPRSPDLGNILHL